MTVRADDVTWRDRLTAARRRATRPRPSHIDKRLLWVVILCWVATLILSLLILSDTVSRDADVDVLDQWLAVTLGGGAASSAFVAALTLRVDAEPRRFFRALRLSGALLLAGFPFLSLVAGGLTWQTAVAAAGLVGGALSYVLAMLKRWKPAVSAIVAAASTFIAWVALALVILQTAFDDRPFLIAYNSISTLASAFLELTAYAAVLLVAAPRRERLDPLLRRPAPRWVVLAVAAGVIGIVALRMTVANEIFGTSDGHLWWIWHWDGIPHAILTAAAIYLVVMASVKRPYRPAGRRLVSWILILSAAAGVLLLAALKLVASVRAVALGQHELQVDGRGAFILGTELTVIGVLSVVVFLFGRRKPRSIGFAIAVVALVYTLVVAVVQMVVSERGWTMYGVPFWSGPALVIVVLIAIVIIRVIVAAIRREPDDRNPAYISLLVTPVVLLHAGTLIPLALEVEFAAPLVVAGTVLALFWFMPPTAADRMRHTAVVLVASAIQVSVLIMWLMTEKVSTYEVAGEGDLSRWAGTLLLVFPLTVAVAAYVQRAGAAANETAAPPLEATRPSDLTG